MADMAASMESGELSVEPELELQERGMESPAKSLVPAFENPMEPTIFRGKPGEMDRDV